MNPSFSARGIVSGLLFLALSGHATGSSSKPNDAEAAAAELVLRNGYIYTADAGRTIAQSLAVANGHILAVGSDADIQPYITGQTEVHDLGGRMVIPGLHDTHIHPEGVVNDAACDLKSEPLTLAEIAGILRRCLPHSVPTKGDWHVIEQWAFDKGNQPNDEFPDLRSMLDEVSTGYRIVLRGTDGHHAAVNSLALQRAKSATGGTVPVTAQSLEGVYAEQAAYFTRAADGSPTGAITDKALGIVGAPAYSERSVSADHLRRAGVALASEGITTVLDAATTVQKLASYRELATTGELRLRVYAALYQRTSETFDEAVLDSLVQRFIVARDSVTAYPLLHANHVKLFVDGVLEGDTRTDPPTLPNAAVLHTYLQPLVSVNTKDGLAITGYIDPNQPDCESKYPGRCTENRGHLEHPAPVIETFVKRLSQAGFAVHAHAVGDRAVSTFLDAVAAARASGVDSGIRHSIAHAQLVNPADQRRLSQLDVGSVFTFAWAEPVHDYDLLVLPFQEHLRGNLRKEIYENQSYYLANAYPARSILDQGGLVAAGSDAPVDSRSPRPFYNIEKAVTRSNDNLSDKSFGATLNARQRLDIHQAIAAYTYNAARLLGSEQETGSIEVGKLADLAVLDKNLVELAESGRADLISDTRVTMTVFNGQVVYQRPERQKEAL